MWTRRDFVRNCLAGSVGLGVIGAEKRHVSAEVAESKEDPIITGLQYYRSKDQKAFAGDPILFEHEGRFHVFYLFDRKHGCPLDGVNGHVWAHLSSTDLVHWQRHPVAIPLGPKGTADSLAIATGSVIFWQGKFHAFYSTKILHENGRVTQHVCTSTSEDCIHFVKSKENPIVDPPSDYDPCHFRDPHVFQDESGMFHMLVASKTLAHATKKGHGCIAHLTSKDLKTWTNEPPFLVPDTAHVPECPDYFYWNGYYYLTFLAYWQMHYRVSKEPFGPWLKPEVDTFDGRAAAAFKTGCFAPDRRLAVGFVRWRDRDDGPWPYAGNLLFREIVQQKDGTLWTRFPEEMIPPHAKESLPLAAEALTGKVKVADNTVQVLAEETFGVARLKGSCREGRITCRVVPKKPAAEFGFGVRGAGLFDEGYEVRFMPRKRMVWIRNRCRRLTTSNNQIETALYGVEGLDRPFSVDLVLHDDFIDLCVDGRRCLISRFPEWKHAGLYLFSHGGDVAFEEFEVFPSIEGCIS